jgi:hypothetical protein
MYIALANLHQYLLVIGQQNLYVYITTVGVPLTVFSLQKTLRLIISYWNILHFYVNPTQTSPTSFNLYTKENSKKMIPFDKLINNTPSVPKYLSIFSTKMN